MQGSATIDRFSQRGDHSKWKRLYKHRPRVSLRYYLSLFLSGEVVCAELFPLPHSPVDIFVTNALPNQVSRKGGTIVAVSYHSLFLAQNGDWDREHLNIYRIGSRSRFPRQLLLQKW